MKKKAALLVSLALTLLPLHAAVNYDICEGEEQVLTATKTGKSYQWLQDGVKIPNATQQTYTATESGNYTCEITQEGGGTTNFNLVEYGNFDFEPNQINSKRNQTINDPLTGKKYNISYELRNFDQSGKADPGHSTTTKNPNLIKPQYFQPIPPKAGSHLLACDGGSGEWQVWNVRNMKLKKGQDYQFSCWAANIDKEYFTKHHGKVSLPKIAFIIETKKGKQELGTGFMTLSENLGKWEEFKATYTPEEDHDWAHLYIINKTAGAEGNDFALDEVYFGAVPTSTTVVKEDFTVNVHAIPVIQLTEPQTVCEGDEAIVKATITGTPTQISWTENGIQMANIATTLKVNAPASGATNTYKIKVSSGSCPEQEAQTTVTGKTCGLPPIDHPAQNACLGSNVTLTAETIGDKYLWSNGEGTRSITVPADKLGEIKYSCTVELPSEASLKNNIIPNGGFEDISKQCPYVGFESEYMCYEINEDFDMSLPHRGFYKLSTYSHGIDAYEGNTMLECDGDEYEQTAWSTKTTEPIVKGMKYQFSYSAASIGDSNPAKLTYYIEYNGKKEVLVPEQALNLDNLWHEYGVGIYWTAPEDCAQATLSLVDNCLEEAWNDFCIDNIMFQPYYGDDSEIVENFTINVEVCEQTIEINDSICEGESYTFHGKKYTQAGDYEYKYVTEEGVKMTEILHLKVNQPSFVKLTDEICDGAGYDKYNFDLTPEETHNQPFKEMAIVTKNISGCDSTVTMFLTIHPLPVFEIAVEDQAIEVNVEKGKAPYIYTVDNGATYTEGVITDLPFGTHELKVTDANQCESTLTFYIEQQPLHPQLYFTPNGDGFNDTWNIEGLQYYPTAILQIYDRYNKRLAHYHVNEFTGWDGMYNGHQLPADDYWFLLTIPELEKQITGHFTLKR